jgi:hypothetical protein
MGRKDGRGKGATSQGYPTYNNQQQTVEEYKRAAVEERYEAVIDKDIDIQ